MTLLDTIVAEATAPFESALAIVRIAGPQSLEITSRVTGRDLSKLRPRTFHTSKLYDRFGKIIDFASFVFFAAGASYTGEESAEFYVHGSRVVVEELLDTLVALGARRAAGGEFTAKAYFNSRLSLTAAEAVNSLIRARSSEGKRLALETMDGGDRRLGELRERLLAITSGLEVSFDYDDIMTETEANAALREDLGLAAREARSLVETARSSLYYLDGIKVALVGKPNVGKSTLLNAVLGYDKAIVTPVPGTTRDVVEGEKVIGGIPFLFQDTAGIRADPDEVEKLGIAKSYETLESSDVVIYVFERFDKEEFDTLGLSATSKPVLKVQNKSDLLPLDPAADISIAAISREVDGLLNLIRDRLAVAAHPEGVVASRRDLDLLEETAGELESALADLENRITVDVVETRILTALHRLDELLGLEQTMEDVYQTIFSKFCVGK